MIDEGYYTGTITAAWLERDDRNQSDDLIMCFELAIDGQEETTARHATTGKNAWSGRGVAKLLDLKWPAGLREIETTIGREVPVRIKHKTSERTGDTYCNAYIQALRESNPATPEQIEAGLAKLEAEDDDGDAPF